MYHPSYDINLKLIDRFAKKGPLDIIDYGCGNGILLELLDKKRVKRYHGYEVSKAALEVARQKYGSKQRTFSYFSPGKPPYLGESQGIDLIILVGVLQYMSDQEVATVLKESHRVLKKGGIFLASTVTDHAVYRWLNMYRFILPNRYHNSHQLQRQLQSAGFNIAFAKETGLVIGPLFSHGFVILFDAIDKLIFRNRGKLGPLGIMVRKVFKPVMNWEYRLPINFGYTFFVVGKK